ncbi:MAG: VanW family protein [Nocardioides sp.]|nr:VanW family protein [Nocardioides sp.]
MNAAAPTPKGERAGGWLVLLVMGGLALLVAGGYGAAYAVASEKVPVGTSVAGVDIGGRTEADAAASLRAGLADRVERRLAVSAGPLTERLRPTELGLGVDYAASVSEAGGGRSWRPRRLWDYFTGGRELPAVLAVDQAVLAQALATVSQQLGATPIDGAVSFVDGRVEMVAPQPGQQIDGALAEQALTEALLDDASDSGPVELPLTTVQPAIDTSDLEEAVTSFANPAVSGPVTLVFGTTSVRLQPRDFASALAMRPEDGELVPDLDTDQLAALVATATAGAGAPVDATVTLVDGRPQVTKAQPGVSYAPESITNAFLDTLRAPEGQRELTVEATVAEPAVSTKEARALKIKERVSSFTTAFPYAEYRNTNIGRAAEIVNGTVLAPGDTFSMNDVVGERTRENGFTEGFVISDGIFKEDLGGGVSQMATTLFNAGFFAGLEDVEHKPHSFYIDRYPVGREATVVFGSVDLRFRNDTPYGVLVQAVLAPSTPSSQGELTVTMWSTKTWDITTSTGERYNPTPPRTRTLRTDDCYPNTGYAGFDIDVVRFFREPGQSALARQENFTTTYTPSDTVICRPPPRR